MAMCRGEGLLPEEPHPRADDLSSTEALLPKSWSRDTRGLSGAAEPGVE